MNVGVNVFVGYAERMRQKTERESDDDDCLDDDDDEEIFSTTEVWMRPQFSNALVLLVH